MTTKFVIEVDLTEFCVTRADHGPGNLFKGFRERCQTYKMLFRPARQRVAKVVVEANARRTDSPSNRDLASKVMR